MGSQSKAWRRRIFRESSEAGQFESFRSGLIASASPLSQTIRSETDKLAYGLALITLTLAGIRFAATTDPTTAWADIFEAFMLLGIFAAIYAGYDKFAPGIFDWFKMLGDKIAGTRSSNPALTLISDTCPICRPPIFTHKASGLRR